MRETIAPYSPCQENDLPISYITLDELKRWRVGRPMAKVRRMGPTCPIAKTLAPKLFRPHQQFRFPITLAPTLRHNPTRTKGCWPPASPSGAIFVFEFASFEFPISAFGSFECPTDHGVPPHLQVNSVPTSPPTKTSKNSPSAPSSLAHSSACSSAPSPSTSASALDSPSLLRSQSQFFRSASFALSAAPQFSKITSFKPPAPQANPSPPESCSPSPR